MPRSLRFRLPAIFFLGIVFGGLLTAAIALRLFQDLERDRSYNELRREATGIAQLYAAAALRAAEQGASAPDFAPQALEFATGDRLFYIGARVFPGQESGLKQIPESSVPPGVRSLGSQVSFEFVPPTETRSFLAVAEPLRLEPDADPLGAIIVAKPEAELRTQWVPLLQRMLLAFAVGSLLSGVVGWWMSRRITRPVLQLAEASEEIAAGNYGVRVAVAGVRNEIGHLSERFNEMAARLGASEERERQFLMSVSHELRTPLTAIRGHVDALRDGVVDDPELIESSLDIVAAEAERLERLVGDIVDLAKLRAHRFTAQSEEVDMGRLVEQAHGAFADEARRREIDYELELPDEPPTLITDGDRVLQVITNFLKNAFRWTPDGGRIVVTLCRDDDSMTVSVKDSGPGISQHDQERIFSPFVSRDNQGTGLGLPISRELAGVLGGRVELASRLGAGSTFSLMIPLRPTMAGPRR
ncbi:MAG: HAMP domain-containing sensor histidine kinase [Gaiellales bacterium]